MKFKLISSRNASEFEKLINSFISNNKIERIEYNTVSDDGFVIFIAYIEYS
ncbi:MAG: hypothetical protein Q4P31_01455 [Andreesenia angusta]|nr:hypothetical protein [Andreesenia angusta]